MYYVINGSYGGYEVPAEVRAMLNCGAYDEEVRSNFRFVRWVMEHYDTTDLEVVEIPAGATDWELDEYDGYESVIAVVNGRIVHLDTLDPEVFN